MTNRPEHPLVAPVVGCTPEVKFLLQSLRLALDAAYSGSAEHGAFLRNGGGEYVPSPFMTLNQLAAALVPRPEPREPKQNHASQEVHANDKVPFVPATVSNVGTRLTTSMALVDLVERLRQKRFALPIHGHSTCAADPDVVKWEHVEAFLAAAVRPASAPSLEQQHYQNAHNGQVVPESCVACRAFAILDPKAFSTREDMIRAIDAYREGEAASAPSRPLEEMRPVLRQWLNSRTFYDLLWAYRRARLGHPVEVTEAFERIKSETLRATYPGGDPNK